MADGFQEAVINQCPVGQEQSDIPNEEADLPEGCVIPSEQEEPAVTPTYEDSGSAVHMLFNALKKPLPSKMSAKEITDEAHKLIDNLNIKRKHDTKLLEEWRQELDAYVQSAIDRIQQNLFQTYEKQRLIIEDKLQVLFSSLNRVAATESEIDNFRCSLHTLYEEMQNLEK